MTSRIVNRVREARLAAGRMTQQELADRVGVSRQTINAIEAGRYAPSLEVALKLGRVFGQSLERLFVLDGDLRGPAEG